MSAFQNLFGNDYYYENFSFGSGALVSLYTVIIGLAVGIVGAIIYANVKSLTILKFIRTLKAAKCFSENSAKTLSELGYTKNKALSRSLRAGMLRDFVKCVPAEENNENGDASDRFFVPENDIDYVERRFSRRTYGIGGTILMIVIAAVVCFGLLLVIPELLQMLDNLISGFRE